jgi:hypothetical protein
MKKPELQKIVEIFLDDYKINISSGFWSNNRTDINLKYNE